MTDLEPPPAPPPAPRPAWLRLFAVIALTLALDQVTKRLVLDNLLVGETLELIPALVPYFQITLSYNRGAAFGLLPQFGYIFVLFAFAVLIGVLIYYPRIARGAWLTQIAVGMLVGGALGNAIDRLSYDAVVDFIHYRIPGVISNVSNLADHAIVLSVILLVILSWRRADAEKSATIQHRDGESVASSAEEP